MKDAILNTEFGEIGIRVTGGGWHAISHELFLADADTRELTLSIGAPDTESPEPTSITATRRFYNCEASEVEKIARLWQFAAQLARLMDAANYSAIQAEIEKEAEEDKVRAEEQEKEEAVHKEREEIMLNELMGERIKVRHRRYKTMCYGEVISRANDWDNDGNETGWEPRIRYSDQGATRDYGVSSYARLDAKTAKGWRTVWDDGKEDLPEYDRGVKLPEVRPWHG